MASPQERTRKAIEQKLEEAQLEEKAAVVQERRELFQQRKAQTIRVARIEDHLETVAEVRGQENCISSEASLFTN